MANSGMSMKAIADIYNISRERMRQVFSKYTIIQSLEIKRKKREAAHYKRYGDRTLELYEIKKQKYTNKRHSANSNGIPFTLGFGDLEWPTHCPILGVELDYQLDGRKENSPSIDRIDNTKGYVPGNVAVLSWRANRIKNDGTSEEHEKIAQWMQKKLAI